MVRAEGIGTVLSGYHEKEKTRFPSLQIINSNTNTELPQISSLLFRCPDPLLPSTPPFAPPTTSTFTSAAATVAAVAYLYV
ncbi:hypothetical protein GQ457_02G016520 [Hibiscus cannabinus]